MGPDRPFYDLLPELYKQDKLLNTVIAVFEEQYMKIERTIDKLPETLYDPARTPDEYLDFLWDMFGLEACGKIFSRKQKRELLPLAYLLQRQKGTRNALERILKAFVSDLCGYWVSPVIMEYGSWSDYECPENMKDMYRKRFGGEDDFTVFIPPEPALRTRDAKDRIGMLLEEFSPVDAVARLIISEPQAALGEDCYLGFCVLSGSASGPDQTAKET